jgi:uncharacterized protein YjbJ (UPF0337 family)
MMNSDDRDEVQQRAHDAADRVAHSGAADKAKGHVKETVGKVKEKVGKAIGDKELEGKGLIERAEGKQDRLKGEVKEKLEDLKDHVKAGVEVLKEKVKDLRD